MNNKKYVYVLFILSLMFLIIGCSSTKETKSNLPEPNKTFSNFLDLFMKKDWIGIDNIVTQQTKLKYPKVDDLRKAINQEDQIELVKVIKIVPVENEGGIGFGLALVNQKTEGKVGKDILSIHMKKEKGLWKIAIDPSDYTYDQNVIRVKLEKKMEKKFTEMKKLDPEVKMFWSEYERQVNNF